MDKLINNLARVLATPMPRRKAVQLLTKAVVGGIAMGFGTSRLAAQSQLPAQCGANVYESTGTATGNCDGLAIPPDSVVPQCPAGCCIRTFGTNVCFSCTGTGNCRRWRRNYTCTPIAAGQPCNTTTQSTCCAPPTVAGGSTCCNGVCCAGGTSCTNQVCCAAGSTGCNGVCCNSDQCCVSNVCQSSNEQPCA